MTAERGRKHAKRLQCQHTGSIGKQATGVRCNHRDDVGVRPVGLLQIHVHAAFLGECDVGGVQWVRDGQVVPCHHHAAPADEFPDERGLPVAPHPRPRRERVRLGEGVQQLQQHGVGTECLHHRLHRDRIVEITSCRGVR